MTAISDLALAYTDADLERRFLVVYEAAGMLGEFASYLIRSLLSEARLVYEVVEKTTNGFRPCRIDKKGPSGLLVTTTAVRLPEREVAQALALGKSAASRRISTTIQLGYLRKMEDRKGRPARVCLGDPIPDEMLVLPDAQALQLPCFSVDERLHRALLVGLNFLL